MSHEATASAHAFVPEAWTVLDIHAENADTVTVELVPPLPRPVTFEPGQFNLLYVPGYGEVAVSISGDPSVRDRLTHTVRAIGAATMALSDLRIGDALGVRGPFGHPWPMVTGENVVIVAGGIGLASLRPVITLLATVAEPRFAAGLKTVLCYGARSPHDRIFASELAAWATLPGWTVASIVDHADRDWDGPVGVVTNLLEAPLAAPRETVALICGPETMMRFTAIRLAGLGIATDRIHLSIERNMKCAVGFCGHCQLGPLFICKDGPVLTFERLEPLWRVREL
jgi:NAD(P)H-flavin reductase